MKSMSLYEHKNSFLNGLSPRTKELYIATAILTPFILGSIQAKVVFVAVSIILLLHSKVLSKTLPILLISSVILLTVFVIHGMFHADNVTAVLTLGILTFYKEGLLFASNIALNILNIIFSFCVLVLTSKPADIVDELVRKGLSPRIGYVFLSLFLLIPQMTDRVTTISDAQRSRGMETDGNLFVRIKAFIPLISPVIMSSFLDTKERSIALEVRGFNSKSTKSYLNIFEASKADKPIFVFLILILIATLVWRVYLWLI